MNSSEATILIVGSGAIGASIASWLAPVHSNLWIYDLPEVTALLQHNGISSYQQHSQYRQHSQVKTIDKLEAIEPPDFILICVKNYSLSKVCQLLKQAYGSTPIAVGLQNGDENQRVLPLFFDKIIYGVICYNAWLDNPTTVGFQKKGPLIFGTLNNTCPSKQLDRLCLCLSKGVEAIAIDNIQDAIVSKIIINLSNSLTTLVGFGFAPIENEDAFQSILTRMAYEGIQVAKKHGLIECKLGGMPGWKTIQFADKAPKWITRPIFKKNLAKMVISSMAQDLLQHKRHDNELDTINGAVLRLADEKSLDIPVNRTIYALCKSAFAQNDFQPMKLNDVYSKVKRFL